MKDKIFIGSGFIDSQLLWLLPLVYGYSKKKRIRTIIFHRKLSNRLKKNKIFMKFLKKFNVLYLDDLTIFKKNFVFKWILIIFFIFPKAIILSIKTSKKKLLNKEINWKDNQIFHSIWDTAIKESPDGVINPSYLKILMASLIAAYNKYEAKIVLKQKVKHFFLGHSVYGYRAFLSEVRKKGHDIFCHSGFTIYKQYSNRDSSWCFIQKKFFNKLVKKTTNKQVINYWKLRKEGKGNYEDSRIAARIKNKNKSNYSNIIFLHIFRDSPFADIDRNRIFEDYISWIDFTLDVLKNSNEKWLLRLHPSYKRWGEDQHLTLNKIFNRKFSGILPDNIKIEDNVNSNYEIFKHAKRIVTFNGTSHLEAACFGIRPIIISNTMLNILDDKLVIKPKKLLEYKNVLLENSNTKKFKLSNKEVFLAKKIMFVREKALKFEKEVGGFHVFQGDPSSKLNEDMRQTEKKLFNNLEFLTKNGEKIYKNNKFTLSPSFLK